MLFNKCFGGSIFSVGLLRLFQGFPVFVLYLYFPVFGFWIFTLNSDLNHLVSTL